MKTEPEVERKLVCVTPDDHMFIEELYRKIIKEYKAQAALAGIKPTVGKIEEGPKIRHVTSFLREHAVFEDKDIKEFAAKFVD